MTYEELLEVFESAARTADSTASYVRGRIEDISLESVVANRNLIYVEDSLNIQAQSQAATEFETWTVRIGFLRQDSTASEAETTKQSDAAEESRQEIFAATHLIARKFLEALDGEDVMIQGTPSLRQVTRVIQGTFTGWNLTISLLMNVDCDDVAGTEIQDAVYQNSDESFEVSIKRGVVYTAPDINVTDSDNTTYSHPANKDVVCTPSGSVGTPATVKNSDDTYSEQVACGGTLILPDETHSAYIDGNLNQTFTHPPLSDVDINIWL